MRQLHSPKNLILLCGVCHKVIDDQPDDYPAQVLQTLKEQHIKYVREATQPLDKRQSVIDVSAKPVGIDLVEKEVGIRWSNRTDVPAQIEIVRFRGQLLAKAKEAKNNISKWYELFRLRNGLYLVYREIIYNLDYSEANLFGANAWGETNTPLTLDRLQNEFPFLAKEAGLPRIREFDPL